MPINKIFIQFYLLIFILFIFPSLAFAFDTSRPGPENIPTDVLIELYVVDIAEINDGAQSFNASIFIEAKWKDQRLVSSNEKTTYNLKDVWNPDLQIINRGKLFLSYPEIVEVDSEGTVVYKQRFIGDFSQPLDLHRFPVDQQKLEFQIVSAGYSPDEVNLIEDSVGLSEKLSIPDWDIMGINLKKIEYKILPNKPADEGLLLEINAKRFVQFYFFKFIVPLILIVIMSWMVFWIDPTNSSTQISVSITSMLTLIAYQFLAVGSLPAVPYLTRMDMVMLSSTVLVFASLVEVVITSFLVQKNKVELARSIDNYCRYIFPATFLLILIHHAITI
jgi:hypothetical protein